MDLTGIPGKSLGDFEVRCATNSMRAEFDAQRKRRKKRSRRIGHCSAL
jgi:hypothetical protein